MSFKGYGLTESAAAVGGMVIPEESLRWGSVGKISEWVEAKIVDPETGDALTPFKQGELWIKGATTMKGKKINSPFVYTYFGHFYFPKWSK